MDELVGQPSQDFIFRAMVDKTAGHAVDIGPPEWYCCFIQYHSSMQTALQWKPPRPPALLSAPASSPVPASPPQGRLVLPPLVEAAIWRGTELGSAVTSVLTTGWPALDAELPGGGWPMRAVSEVLAAQPYALEWRLLSPTLRRVATAGGQMVAIGPARHPHLPGLLHEGMVERQFIWIQAEAPSERLWVTEQLIKSNSAGAIVAWLPQARQEQIRRLQVCAQGCDGPVFLCRPEAARHEASAAPLRVHASVSLDWELRINVFKRRGAVHDGQIVLPSVPGGLHSVLTPRLRRPMSLIAGKLEDVSELLGQLPTTSRDFH